MKKPPIDSGLSKSKGLIFLEYILLALCLCVIALRTTFTEGPATSSTALPANLWDSVYSLSVSASLFIAFVCWFVCSFCSRRFLYRFTGMEIGLCLFCVAAVIAGFAASNKRAAITNAAVLLAPIFMAILLVQILDSPSKVKLLLALIAASGVISASQCADQFFSTDQMTIKQYEEAPQTMLKPLGIEPNTLQHFLFEHRLYSKGVRGFFTTRNSAGSFLLIASFAAIALFIDKFNVLKSSSSSAQSNPKLNTQNSKLSLFACGFIIAIILFALALTRSKGAILGLLFAAALFCAFLSFGNRIKNHNKIILIACLLLFIAGGCIVTWYGLTHDHLPGGSSMLVRWQYWNASVKMYADHPLTGVGPGNFTDFYPRYKPAEALESVADPHNLLLSILTQYSPLGLIGFLAMIFIPLWKTTSPLSIEYCLSAVAPAKAEESSIEKKPSIQAHHQSSFRAPAIIYLIIVSAAMLLIRPMIMRATLGDTFEVKLYLILTLYVVPAAVFIIAFWLLTAPLNKIRHTKYEILNTNTAAALFCAVLGVTLHNLIDFAIFEPPVFTTFWAIIACLIAIGSQQNTRPLFVLKPAPAIRILMVTTALAVIWAYFNYALIPVARSTARIQKAHRAISDGQFQRAYNFLTAAAEDDRLDPTASNLEGRLYLQHYDNTAEKQPSLLRKAEQCFLEAIAHDYANFKNYEKLSTVYDLLGQHQNAYDWGRKAGELYPGSAQIHFELAQIAEKLSRIDDAINHYKNAIDIEDSFQRQFKIMYPHRKIVSRLGEDKYQLATERMKALKKQQKQEI